MTTNFPNSADSFVNPQPTDPVDSPSHATQHQNANDAIEAMQNYILQNTPSAGTYIGAIEKGQPSGVATLDGNGLIPLSEIPGVLMAYASGPDYNVSATDFGKWINADADFDQTFNLSQPTNDAGLVGKYVIIYAAGLGSKNITSQYLNSTGATPNSPILRTQFSSALAVYQGEGSWIVVGDIV